MSQNVYLIAFVRFGVYGLFRILVRLVGGYAGVYRRYGVDVLVGVGFFVVRVVVIDIAAPRMVKMRVSIITFS